jgi:hypothetical protein
MAATISLFLTTFLVLSSLFLSSLFLSKLREMERGRKSERLRLRERECGREGDSEVGGCCWCEVCDWEERRGRGMFISVYSGSSCAFEFVGSSSVRTGAQDSWVGVVA